MEKTNLLVLGHNHFALSLCESAPACQARASCLVIKKVIFDFTITGRFEVVIENDEKMREGEELE